MDNHKVGRVEYKQHLLETIAKLDESAFRTRKKAFVLKDEFRLERAAELYQERCERYQAEPEFALWDTLHAVFGIRYPKAFMESPENLEQKQRELFLKVQAEHFKNHVATLQDFGTIKILDFKDPDSNHYRIRFLFEEEYFRLHISGDLGDLIACHYYNMCFEKFERDYANHPGALEGKVSCHNRAFYTYEANDAREELEAFINEYELEESLKHNLYAEDLEEVLEELLEEFDEAKGIGQKGFDALNALVDDCWQEISDFGKKTTGILDLYMLAYRLAMQQLREQKNK